VLVRHRERVLILYDRVSIASETIQSRLSTCSVVTDRRIAWNKGRLRVW
jgi:hypothetical protein